MKFCFNKEEKILFLPDSKRKFTGELIDNIRKPLVNNANTRNMLKVGERIFEIKKKYHDGKIKIGVNEPCPCRSGKKYKKCCIKSR